MADSTPLDILNDIPIRDERGRFSLVGNSATAATAAVSHSPHTATAGETARVDELVQKISAQGAVTMGDEVLERRLRNAVAVFVKGVRNELQTREALSRSRANGGLGLDAVATDLVMQLLRPRPKLPTPAVPPAPVADPIPTPPPVMPRQPIRQFTAEELDHELPGPPRTKPLPKPRAPMATKETLRAALHITQQAVAPRLSAKAVKPFADRPLPPPLKPSGTKTVRQRLYGLFHHRQAPPPPPSTFVQSSPAHHAPPDRITDVRPPSRLVNPIEELRRIRLVDWRAAGEPAQAITRIQEKIELIGKDNFPQGIQARAAWRESEVHRLYLAMGKEAIERQQSLATVIAARQHARAPFLTSGEYTALAKLSHMLEY